MHNNEENLETNDEVKIDVKEITFPEQYHSHGVLDNLMDSTLLGTGVPKSLIQPLTPELSSTVGSYSPLRGQWEIKNSTTGLKSRFMYSNDEGLDIDHIFNKIRFKLGIGINSTDTIRCKLKDTIIEIIENDFDCEYDYLKSFLSVILRNMYTEDKGFKNIISTFRSMFILTKSSRYPVFMGDNIKVEFEYDVLYDIILYTICEHNIDLLKSYYIDNTGILFTNASFGVSEELKNLLGKIYSNDHECSIKEIYELLDGIPGLYLFYSYNNILLQKIVQDNCNNAVPRHYGNRVLDNNFDILSERDRIKCSLYLYLNQFNSHITYIDFLRLEELACKIECGECSFELVQENCNIFISIYNLNSVPLFTTDFRRRREGVVNDGAYNDFISKVKFYNENELDYDEILEIYGKSRCSGMLHIIHKNGYDYLKTQEDERLSHFKGEDTDVEINEFDVNKTKFEEDFKKFLIKKFRRSLSDNVLFKLCHHAQFDGIEKLKSRFNKTTIKSLRSVKFANPTLIYMATFYDLSNLNLRTRMYLNYFIDDLNKFNKIKDSTLLKYILKNGNNLSNENLDKILSHININGIESLSNIKDIRLHIIKNEMEVEKERAEREYEFDFEKDSVCELIDNPIELNGYRMRLLDPKDPKVFIVGKLCDCCYHMGGAAEESMIYSILMANSGNIVIEDIVTKEIIATAWVWYDEENDIYVYDNFEFSNDSLLESCIDIIEEYSMKLPYKNVHVGLDYNEDMAIYFKKLYGYNEAEFVESDNEDLDDVYSDYVDESKAVIKISGNSNRRDPRLI